MNLDATIKKILLKINMNGREVSLTRDQRYNKEFNSIGSKYRLVFWYEFEKKNKRTGEMKISRVPDIHKFNNQSELIKYMVGVMNERKTEDIR